MASAEKVGSMRAKISIALFTGLALCAAVVSYFCAGTSAFAQQAAPSITPSGGESKVVPITSPGKGVLTVEYLQGQTQSEVMIRSARSLEKVEHFFMDNPSRLVVDIFGVRERPVTKEIGRPELSRIRLGVHKDKTRVVLEFPQKLNPPPEINKSAQQVRILLAKVSSTASASDTPKSSPAVSSGVPARVEPTPVSQSTPSSGYTGAAPASAQTAAAPISASSQAQPVAPPVSPPEPAAGYAGMAKNPSPGETAKSSAVAQARPQAEPIPLTPVESTPQPIVLDPQPGETPKTETSDLEKKGLIGLTFDRQYLTGSFAFIINGDKGVPSYSIVTMEERPPTLRVRLDGVYLIDKIYHFPINKPALTAVSVQEEPENKLSFSFLLPPDGQLKLGVNPVIREDKENRSLVFYFMEPVETETYFREYRKEYTGKKISLDFQAADIHSVLRILAAVGGTNIIASDQALDTILQVYNLRSEKIGNVIWVITYDEYKNQRELIAKEKDERAKEEEARARRAESELKLRERREALKPLVTEIIYFSYAKADEVGGKVNVPKKESALPLDKLLSERGTSGLDTHNNALIITDTVENVTKIRQMAQEIDRPTPQVLIEARIVEARSNLDRELGIEWKAHLERPSGALDGGVSLPTTHIPAGTLGVTFGRVINNTLVNLDAELSALEEAGKARIISSPRVLAMNNQEAVITQGTQVPITTRTEDGTFSTTYIDAALKLTVVPRVVPNLPRLSLALKLEEKQVLERQDVLGNPHLATKEARTVMLVDSGDTMVVGGITASELSENQRRIPCIGSIPIIGWAFKSQTTADDKRELLMFITATIVDQKTDKATVRTGEASPPTHP
jgi:type IV pilus secretin PilQ/predicted competence protein